MEEHSLLSGWRRWWCPHGTRCPSSQGSSPTFQTLVHRDMALMEQGGSITPDAMAGFCALDEKLNLRSLSGSMWSAGPR